MSADGLRTRSVESDKELEALLESNRTSNASPRPPPAYRPQRDRRRAFGPLIGVVVVSIILGWLLIPHSPPRATRATELDGILVDPSHRARFTLITVFGGSKAQVYLSMFLQSVAQNPSIKLLFVNENQGSGCLDLSYVTDPSSLSYASNIQHVCITTAQHQALYAEYLCNLWGGCSGKERARTMRHLLRIRREAGKDEKWIEDSEWFGWADADQLLGRFDMLPHDIMASFDLILASDWATTNHEPLYVPGWLGWMRMSEKTRRLALRYPGFASPADVVNLLPGNHHYLLDEKVYSEIILRNSTDIDVLRIPHLAAGDALDRRRRLVLAQGLLLSVHVDLPRHELAYALDRYLDWTPGPSFTTQGFVRTPISIDWTPPDEVCNGVPWNPIGACPPELPSAAMSTYLYRKDGVWSVRYEPRDPISALDAPPAVMPVFQAHFLHSKKAKGFSMPDMTRSGYLQDLQSDSIAVFEIGPAFWAVWRWKRGDRTPAPGFTEAAGFVFRDRTPFDFSVRQPSRQSS